jgi:membrane-associated phospholipid phosphatase
MTRHRLFSAGVQILLSAFLWSIIASTVFIKQHALADVIGGILLAEMAYRVVHYILDKQQKAPITKPNDSSVTLNG